MLKMPIDGNGNIRYFESFKIYVLISFLVLFFTKTTTFFSILLSSQTALISSVTVVLYTLSIIILAIQELVILLKLSTYKIFVYIKKTNILNTIILDIIYQTRLYLVSQFSYLRLNVIRC